jgi:hypothetical protein
VFHHLATAEKAAYVLCHPHAIEGWEVISSHVKCPPIDTPKGRRGQQVPLPQMLLKFTTRNGKSDCGTGVGSDFNAIDHTPPTLMVQAC